MNETSKRARRSLNQLLEIFDLAIQNGMIFLIILLSSQLRFITVQKKRLVILTVFLSGANAHHIHSTFVFFLFCVNAITLCLPKKLKFLFLFPFALISLDSKRLMKYYFSRNVCYFFRTRSTFMSRWEETPRKENKKYVQERNVSLSFLQFRNLSLSKYGTQYLLYEKKIASNTASRRKKAPCWNEDFFFFFLLQLCISYTQVQY